MGVDKGLIKYKQTFWLLEQLHRISDSNISTVYIGLGYNFQRYFNAISWLKKTQETAYLFEKIKVKVVINKFPEKGSFSTLQNVLNSITEEKDVIINPIDIPVLNSKELNSIISIKNSVVIPHFENKNGHPIKLNFEFWKNLCELDLNNEFLRLDYQIKKINPNKISNIEVFDRVITLNINTKKDWLNYLNSSL